MLIRVFLHAEFSVKFFEIFTETLEQNIRKSHKKMFFRWKRRQINKN